MPAAVVTGCDEADLSGLQAQITALQGLLNHSHTYLTGPGPGQNIIDAETSPPLP